MGNKGIATSKRGSGRQSLTLDDFFMYEDRFWSNVDGDPLNPFDCRFWEKSCFSHGYGSFAIRGIMCTSHSIAWILLNKMLIPDKMLVTHQCTSCGYERPHRTCCNPFHLTLGTHASNAKDKYRDGYKNKLDYDDAREIRRLASEGMLQNDIADLYGVNQSGISRIVNNKILS